MQRFCHRIVIAALTSVMLIPLGMQAQEQSKDQSSQPQSGNQETAAVFKAHLFNLVLL